MASTIALRALCGATLGLGALDLIWLDLHVAPTLLGSPAVAAPVAPAPAPPPAPAPGPTQVASSEPVIASPAEQRIEPIARVESIYFESLSTRIDSDARDMLAMVAVRAARDIVVIGHSDARGDAELNRALRMRRALAVRDHLGLLGIAAERIHVRAAEPDAATAVDEAELWRDRRVEIHFTMFPLQGGSR